MKIEDIENAIDQKQFLDIWNNVNTKQPQALPIQNSNIWKAHFEKLYAEKPINLINSDQCIIK